MIQVQTARPEIGAEIDWSHPLAVGLVGLWWFAGGPTNTILNLEDPAVGNGTLTGSPAWTGGPFGPALTLSTTGPAYVAVGQALGLSGATQASLFVVANRAAGANLFVGMGNSTSDRDRYAIQVATDNNAYFIGEADSRFVSSPTFPFVAASSGRISVANVFDGNLSSWSRISGFLNGARQTLTTGGVAPPASLSANSVLFDIGWERAKNAGSNATIELVALYAGRALTDADVDHLHREFHVGEVDWPLLRSPLTREWLYTSLTAGSPPSTTGVRIVGPSALIGRSALVGKSALVTPRRVG
jgi:hypothetical protein